jgi:hypothetical protein
MKTLHIKGWGSSIDLTEFFSDNYDHGLSFDFEEESTDTLKNIFFRFYSSNKECTLEGAIKGHVKKISGNLTAVGQEYGYSEYTVEGFDVTALVLGGHNLGKIMESYEGKYLHILIDQVERKK